MGFIQLLIIMLSLAIAGSIDVDSNCPSDVVIGQPAELTCEINGTVTTGINWFRSGEGVIVCKKSGLCTSSDPSLYKPNNVTNNVQKFTILSVSEGDLTSTWTCVDGVLSSSPGTSSASSSPPASSNCTLTQKTVGNIVVETDEATGASVGSSFTVAVILVIVDVIIYFVFKDNLSKVKKIYIIYCVVDVLVVGIVCGVSIYYIYLRTSDIGIIAGTCICFLVVSTVIKIIVVKTELFSKCS